LTEALNLTTPGGRAMAAILVVFAAFQREDRNRPVQAWLIRGKVGRQPRRYTPLKSGNYTARASANPKSPVA
jgi:DNA invertase Pin-like site-specific DNA recombinase